MRADLDSGSSLIIPVAGTAGAVVVGEKAAVFLSASEVCSASIQPTLVKVCCVVHIMIYLLKVVV